MFVIAKWVLLFQFFLVLVSLSNGFAWLPVRFALASSLSFTNLNFTQFSKLNAIS